MTLHLVQLAIQNIRSRRTRSWLTILGVLIGVTAVVSLLSIGTGVEQAVLQEFKDIGYDIIVIMPSGAGRATGAADFMMMGEGPPEMVETANAATGTTAMREALLARRASQTSSATTATGSFSPGQVGQAASGATGPATTGMTGRTFSPDQIGTTAATPTTQPSTARAATPVDTEALLKAVPDLVEAGNLGTRIVGIDTPATSGFLRLTTPSLSFLDSFPSILSGFRIAEGTSFTDTTKNEVVIGARSAESLGVGVGDAMTIDGEAFTVVGILAPSKAAAAQEVERQSRTTSGTTRRLNRCT